MTQESDKFRLRELESLVARLLDRVRALESRPAVMGGHRNPRLAKTAIADGEMSYPVSGNTFGIVFVDSTYTQSQGSQSTTDAVRQADAKAVARTIDGTYIAEGQIVPVFFDNARWWIGQPGTPLQIGNANVAINEDASGACSIWEGTPGSETDSGDDVTAFNKSSINIASGAWVWIQSTKDGTYCAPVKCP